MAKNEQRRRGGARVSGNPARRAKQEQYRQRATEAPQTQTRQALNRRSAPLLIWMNSMPRWVIPVVMGLLLVAGLFFSGSLNWVGVLALSLVTIFIGWLFAVSWPAITPGSRLLRGLVVIGLAGITVLKALGRL